ncbi:MAG: ATP-binding cassette domain-containing protein, partial [Dehalococcoidia bacterium]|nr:ATP-binding cassette domain-containing protein [Dehalococcoidia bacterium]
WETLELFHLKERAHDKPDELSGGLRRRLLIARALIHEPKILILDEPTTGLDPQARLFMWENLSLLKSQGVTILLTTHYMEEASYLCDRLVVMDAGKILVEGTPTELIGSYAGEQVIEIRVGMAEKANLLAILQNQTLEFDDTGDSVFIFGKNGVLVPEKIGLEDYRVIQRPGNLEDVFLRLTGRGLRGE